MPVPFQIQVTQTVTLQLNAAQVRDFAFEMATNKIVVLYALGVLDEKVGFTPYTGGKGNGQIELVTPPPPRTEEGVLAAIRTAIFSCEDLDDTDHLLVAPPATAAMRRHCQS